MSNLCSSVKKDIYKWARAIYCNNFHNYPGTNRVIPIKHNSTYFYRISKKRTGIL